MMEDDGGERISKVPGVGQDGAYLGMIRTESVLFDFYEGGGV